MHDDDQDNSRLLHDLFREPDERVNANQADTDRFVMKVMNEIQQRQSREMLLRMLPLALVLLVLSLSLLPLLEYFMALLAGLPEYPASFITSVPQAESLFPLLMLFLALALSLLFGRLLQALRL